MTNASYTALKDGMMQGGVYDLDGAVLKVALVRGYTFSAAHTYMSDVTAAGGVVNGTPAALANRTIVGGVFDADDVTITTVADPNPHVLIVYQASAVAGGADVAATAQRLLWYFDTGTGLQVVPGTGTLTVAWPSTAGRIYKIG